MWLKNNPKWAYLADTMKENTYTIETTIPQQTFGFDPWKDVLFIGADTIIGEPIWYRSGSGCYPMHKIEERVTPEFISDLKYLAIQVSNLESIVQLTEYKAHGKEPSPAALRNNRRTLLDFTSLQLIAVVIPLKWPRAIRKNKVVDLKDWMENFSRARPG